MTKILTRSFAAVLFMGSIHAQTFDATSSFSSANPNGAWAYGTGTLGTSFTRMTVYTNGNCSLSAGISCWQPSTVVNTVPAIARNESASILNFATIVLPTNLLLLHPGPSTDTIVQWTAPQAGTYSIAGFFELLDTAPTGIVGAVFVNSNKVYTGTLTAPAAVHPNTIGARESFSLVQTLAAGAVLSFGVNNDGNYLDDSTGFDATITLVNPNTPTISAGGVLSASGFGGFSSISPGSFIEIYGSSLASDSRLWSGSDFNGINAPTSLDGTSATIGGQQAFINYISPGQIDVLVPSTAPTGIQPLIITAPGGVSAAYSVTVNAVEPGLLVPSSFNINGTQYVAAIFPDGAFALPTGAIAGVTSRPAKPGDTVTLYGIGFGPVVPYIPAGQLVQQANSLAGTLQIFVGGMAATIPYAGLAPSFTGLYQFNVVIPNVAPGIAVPFTFNLNGVNGTQKLNIAVSN